jgi:hypothetical protein
LGSSALLGPDLGDIDVKVAKRIGFELSLFWLVTLYIGQAGDAVALQTAVQ